jgi:hypothetical protein
MRIRPYAEVCHKGWLTSIVCLDLGTRVEVSFVTDGRSAVRYRPGFFYLLNDQTRYGGAPVSDCVGDEFSVVGN